MVMTTTCQKVKETVDATLNRISSSGVSGASYFTGSIIGTTRCVRFDYVRLFIRLVIESDFALANAFGRCGFYLLKCVISVDVRTKLVRELRGVRIPHPLGLHASQSILRVSVLPILDLQRVCLEFASARC